MTIYAMAQLKFTDRVAYDRYQARFFGVFSRFEGTLLAADEQPLVAEGEWPRDKVVLMSFPSVAAWKAFAESPEYEEIARDRRAGADAVVLVFRGFEGVRPARRPS